MELATIGAVGIIIAGLVLLGAVLRSYGGATGMISRHPYGDAYGDTPAAARRGDPAPDELATSSAYARGTR